MSLDATRWAWQQQIKATYKIVLLSLADRADEKHCCYPSIARLTLDTCLDRKTVMSSIKALGKMGLIIVHKKGGSSNFYQLVGVGDRFKKEEKQHYTYKLTDVNTGEFYIGVRTCPMGITPQKDNYFGSGKWCTGKNKNNSKKEILNIFKDRSEAEMDESVKISESINDDLCMNLHDESYRLSSTKNGSTKNGSTKNGSTKNGTATSTKNGTGPVPKTGHKSTNNLPMNLPKGFEQEIPAYVDLDLFEEFLDHRKRVKAQNTIRGVKVLLTEIHKVHEAGFDVNEQMETAISRGWKTVYIPKTGNQPMPEKLKPWDLAI